MCNGIRALPNARQKPNMHEDDAEDVSRRQDILLTGIGRRPWRKKLLTAPTSRDLQARRWLPERGKITYLDGDQADRQRNWGCSLGLLNELA